MLRRQFLRLVPALGIIMLVLLTQASSCRDRCCDCAQSSVFSGTVCEENMPAVFSDWEGCRKALSEGGCSCR